MNLGYCKSLDDARNDAVCPICGSNIYGSKYGMDYKCTNVDCPLAIGAFELITQIDKPSKMIKLE